MLQIESNDLTAVPFATLSEIVFAVPSLSVTGPTAASDVSSVKLIVNVSVENDPSALVARTVMSTVDSVSVSKLAPAATRTTPVFASISNRPEASFVRS